MNVTVFWDEDDKKRNMEAVGFSEMFQKMVIYIATEFKFSTVRHVVLTLFKGNKAKFKEALKKHLNTHTFSSADENFRYKDGL